MSEITNPGTTVIKPDYSKSGILFTVRYRPSRVCPAAVIPVLEAEAVPEDGAESVYGV